MESKLEEYCELLSLSYNDAVKRLLQKYGEGKYNYFSEKSYNNFLAGKTKTITKGKISRTQEGLYCHHIDEEKYLNLANFDFIMRQKPPYEVQVKERLVYCDLIEHVILHALITKETKAKYGYPGLQAFLIPEVIDWYLEDRVPTIAWQKNCYDKSFLNKEDTEIFLSKIKPFLS